MVMKGYDEHLRTDLETAFQTFHQTKLDEEMNHPGTQGHEEVFLVEFNLPENCRRRADNFFDDYSTSLSKEAFTLLRNQITQDYIQKRAEVNQCLLKAYVFSISTTASLFPLSNKIFSAIMKTMPVAIEIGISNAIQEDADKSKSAVFHELLFDAMKTGETSTLNAALDEYIQQEGMTDRVRRMMHLMDTAKKQYSSGVPLQDENFSEAMTDLASDIEQAQRAVEDRNKFLEKKVAVKNVFALISLVGHVTGHHEFAQKTSIVGEGVLSALDGYKSLIDAIASGASAGAMFGPAIAIGTAVYSVFSALVGPKQENIGLKAMLNQLHEISGKITLLTKDMHRGFNKLHEKLDDMYTKIDQSFKQLHQGQEVTCVMLSHLDEKLDALHIHMVALFYAHQLTAFKEERDKLDRLLREQHTLDETVKGELRDIYKACFNWANTFSRSTTAINPNISWNRNGLLPHAAISNFLIAPLESNIGFFQEYASASQLANRIVWQQGVEQLSLLISYYGYGFSTTPKVDIDDLIDTGKRLLSFSESLQKDSTLFQKLFTQSIDAVEGLTFAIKKAIDEEVENTYAKPLKKHYHNQYMQDVQRLESFLIDLGGYPYAKTVPCSSPKMSDWAKKPILQQLNLAVGELDACYIGKKIAAMKDSYESSADFEFDPRKKALPASPMIAYHVDKQSGFLPLMIPASVIQGSNDLMKGILFNVGTVSFTYNFNKGIHDRNRPYPKASLNQIELHGQFIFKKNPRTIEFLTGFSPELKKFLEKEPGKPTNAVRDHIKSKSVKTDAHVFHPTFSQVDEDSSYYVRKLRGSDGAFKSDFKKQMYEKPGGMDLYWRNAALLHAAFCVDKWQGMAWEEIEKELHMTEGSLREIELEATTEEKRFWQGVGHTLKSGSRPDLLVQSVVVKKTELDAHLKILKGFFYFAFPISYMGWRGSSTEKLFYADLEHHLFDKSEINNQLENDPEMVISILDKLKADLIALQADVLAEIDDKVRGLSLIEEDANIVRTLSQLKWLQFRFEITTFQRAIDIPSNEGAAMLKKALADGVVPTQWDIIKSLMQILKNSSPPAREILIEMLKDMLRTLHKKSNFSSQAEILNQCMKEMLAKDILKNFAETKAMHRLIGELGATIQLVEVKDIWNKSRDYCGLVIALALSSLYFVNARSKIGGLTVFAFLGFAPLISRLAVVYNCDRFFTPVDPNFNESLTSCNTIPKFPGNPTF